MKITTSMLFAGDKHLKGNAQCYLCGAGCGAAYLVGDYIKETFTNKDTVKKPGSQYVCVGCVESMGWGDDKMLMLDGTIKERTNDRGMAPRMYSWLITRDNKWAFTKAHVKIIEDIILNNQPEPPFSIILADSGQKHLIFRAPVAMSRNEFPVMLEEEIININPVELKERLLMALPIVAAIGKPVLLEEFKVSTFITYEKYHGNTAGLEAWQEVQYEPLSRLAAWLSKSKEDAQNECPSTKPGAIPEETGGADRPGQEASRYGAGCDQGRSGQALFDFG